MQRGRGGRDPFSNFGDPFAGLGGFGGFGDHRSLLSNFFGGRNPFDDPFFTRPLGGMFDSNPGFFGSSGSPFMNMHPSGFFEHQGSSGSPFMNMHPSEFLEHQAPEPKRPRGPIIEELNSDDEKEDVNKETIENPRKHGRSRSERYVEDPDDEIEGKVHQLTGCMLCFDRYGWSQPLKVLSFLLSSPSLPLMQRKRASICCIEMTTTD